MKYLATVFAPTLVAVFFLIYVVIAYSTGGLNPMEWSVRARGTHAYFSVVLAGAATLFVGLTGRLD